MDRFRELEADIRTCKEELSRYYTNRRRPPGASPLSEASEIASSLANLEWLFAQLKSLRIPLPEYTDYDDRSPRGERFWMGFLGMLESYSKRGYLRGARLRNIHKSIWETSKVGEDIGARIEKNDEHSDQVLKGDT